MTSIRRRLLLGTMLAVAVSSAIASAGAWIAVRAHLIRSAEADLRADAVRLLCQLRCRGDDLHWAGAGPGGAATASSPEGWWAVCDAQGRVRLAASASAAAALAAAADGPLTMPDGARGRAARASGPVAGGRGHRGGAECPASDLTLVLARSDAALAATLAAVAWALGAAAVAAVALAGFAAWLLMRAVVRPVDRIAAAIAGARPDDPRIAVAPGEVPRELRGVVERADAFLAAARDLLGRERQAAANIAHELRTPVAGLAAIIDLALARERPAADYRQALERARAVVGDTARIIEQLLLLTRLESGREPARRETIDLQADLAAVLAGAAAEAASRGVRLPSPAGLPTVQGDPDHLRLVLRNLVGNAVAHAPAGAALAVSAGVAAGRCRLRLANPAGGLAAADLPKLGQPFWRADAARGDTGRHAGLGLALCRRICGINGWGLDFELSGDGFAAVLELPLPAA